MGQVCKAYRGSQFAERDPFVGQQPFLGFFYAQPVQPVVEVHGIRIVDEVRQVRAVNPQYLGYLYDGDACM